MLFRTAVIVVSCAAVFSSPALAQGPEETTGGSGAALDKRVDEIFAQWDRPDSPGCVLTVIKQGDVLYQRGYGMANLESDSPITTRTEFDLGSMSKQFTAACVVLLAESGQISLDDDVRKHLPELPDYGHVITIRHLIHHTSGIRDYTWLMLLARMEFADADEQTRQEIFDLITRQRELYFAPGEGVYYSNSNYFLLGMIVQRVSGLSLGQYAARHLFQPLGMRSTRVRQRESTDGGHRAVGYTQNTDGEFRVKSDRIVFGAGGIHSTATDLFLWDQNFTESRIGGPSFNSTMLTRGKLNNGDFVKYACGLEVGEYRGLESVGFMGYTESFATYMVRFPDQKFSVICLANLGSMRPNVLAMRVADLYLADQLPVDEEPSPPKLAPQVAVAIDPSLYDAYAGGYRFDFGLLMTFSRAGGRFLMQAGKQPQVELLPESETVFFIKDAPVRVSFHVDENGKTTGITMNQKGNEMVAERVDSQTALSPERLQGFTGKYFNDELQVTYTVVFDQGQLSVTAPRDFASRMRHIQGDEFSMSRGDMIFDRNDKRDVTGFLLDVKTERLSFEFAKTAER